MKAYQGFPERLRHSVPHCVEPGALFHVRIGLDREKEQEALTHPALAQEILDSAKLYQARLRWHITFRPRPVDERNHPRLETFSRTNQSCLCRKDTSIIA